MTIQVWRQLKDMKGSADVADVDADTLQSCVVLCSGCLARAHARTGDAAGIVGCVATKNEGFPKAIADFAVASPTRISGLLSPPPTPLHEELIRAITSWTRTD